MAPVRPTDVSNTASTEPATTPADNLTFEQVYTQRWQSSVRLAALTTGSVAIAEEITQDAFIQLHRHWERVDNPVPWLRAAIVNGCRDWVRRRVREPTLRAPVEFVTDEADALAIRDALGVLSPRQRAAVVLRYFEDLPEREIAELLGCRPGTVKSTLSHSLTKLAKELNR
jgi:RNA polymerase sigma factor (sigma-70 family)